MRQANKLFAIGTLLIGFGFILISCHKDSFLDKRPNSDNVIPTALEEFQALLDNSTVMGFTPAMGELSADNVQLDYAYWQTLDARQHNAYVWARDIYQGQGKVDDWNVPYTQVFYANVVLDGLSKRTADSIANDPTWRDVKGQALFIRAYAFWNIAQVFSKVYDGATASSDHGIPLRLHSEVTSVSTRASVLETYQQILQDLVAAKDLLVKDIPTTLLNRASQPAACAMLARVLLSMRDYVNAGLYADSVLQKHDTLLDYNKLSYPSNFPFLVTNPEIIFQSNFISNSQQILVGLAYPKIVVDTVLYNSYDTNDLRKRTFFRLNSVGSPNYRASYNGSVYPFSGLTIDEMFLIRAECRARAGNTAEALSDLNTLLRNRWKIGTFVAVTAGSSAVALDSILVHRRKELPMRGLRWTDLKRLNKEGRNITLMRNLNGTIYTLPPNSLNYVLPIPPDVPVTKGMESDPRD